MSLAEINNTCTRLRRVPLVLLDPQASLVALVPR